MHEPSLQGVRAWCSSDADVGLRADRHPAIDSGVTDECIRPSSKVVELEKLGPAPTRFRRAPRRLLAYRMDDTFGRMRLWIEGEGDTHPVVILGQEQRFLVHGTHPTTPQLYTWETDARGFGEGGLTGITREQANCFLDYLVDLLTGLDALDRSFDTFLAHILDVVCSGDPWPAAGSGRLGVAPVAGEKR